LIVYSIANFQDPRTVEALLTAIDNPKAKKSNKVIFSKALVKITSQDFGQDTNKWRDWFLKHPIPQYSQIEDR
jgi:hypothetical protein